MTDSLLPQTEQKLDLTKSYLNDLVGPDKRYDSPEALARAKYHADEHIKQVEQENKALRDDVLRFREENIAKQKLEDLLDQLQGRKTEPPAQEPKREENRAIDMNQIKSLIDQSIKQTKQTDTWNQNLSTVQQKLIEKYGNDYATHYQQQLQRLDLSKEEADDFARRKPSTFMQMLGIDQPRQQQQYQAPPKNIGSPMPTVPQTRDWAYYENLRKTNRNEYLSQRTQLQMLQDRMEQGDSFMTPGYDPYAGGVR